MLEYRKICIFGKFIGKINTIFYTNWALIHGFCEVDASPTFHLNGIALRVVAIENVVIILFPASECQKGATLAPAVEGALEVLHAGSITEINKALYIFSLLFLARKLIKWTRHWVSWLQTESVKTCQMPDAPDEKYTNSVCCMWQAFQLFSVIDPFVHLLEQFPEFSKEYLVSSCTLYNYQLFKICCQMIYFIHSWKCTQYTGFLKLAQRGKFL